MTSEEKKERPISMINEASNYNMASDYAVHPMSPVGRTSRASKKVHNFGKRSNSIKRNPNAPVVRRGWLYKQDSTGMKLWKKRWFVLSDLCLFYYRDEKEEGILGSILLPSFQIAMLTSEDHINRKFAFKAAHPNMRTYYFCTDTGKEMELWMKAMLDAALVQTEPVKRVDKITTESASTKETNNIPNHRVLIKPEAQNNQKNKEISKIEEKRALEAEKYGFQKDGQERPLTKINSVKLNSLPSEYDSGQACPPQNVHYRPINVNSSDGKAVNVGLADVRGGSHPNAGPLATEADRVLQRTNSMQQLEQWIKVQKGRSLEEEPRGVISYQTLPRNMPSHRAQIVARYPEGYRTLPRNNKIRPESVCGVVPPGHEKAGPGAEEKRRSMRDDTMWQLYEWQQRQFYHKQSTLPRHSCLGSPTAMGKPPDQTMHSIPTSPSHASGAAYPGFSPPRTYRSEVSSPIQRGDVTVDRRHRAHHPKHAYVPDRRSMPAGLALPAVSPQSLQGRTLSQDECRGTLYKYRPEEVDIDAKLSRLCEQDKVVRALEEKLQQLHKEKYTLEQALLSASQEIEMNADNPAAIQTVVLQRDDLQNGLLSTCRELSRATAELERAWREYDKLEYDVTVTRNQMQEQLDRLGEVQSESAGIQRAQIQKELWRIQDVMEGLSKHKQQRGSSETVGLAGSKPFSAVKYKSEEEEVVPPRPPLPRSYDFTEQPPIIPPLPSDSSSLLCYSRGPVHLPEEKKIHQVQGYPRNGSHCGPDYRLYKSEPELTTVAEVDESNGEEKSEPVSETEAPVVKGSHFPVGVPLRTMSPTPESSTIASYVTLRKTKKVELRTERPRSAVEQLCLAESARPRMTVEEQMERIRRHQQACLRERKKGLSVISASDQSPLQSPSAVQDSPFRPTQTLRREDTVQELDTIDRENDGKPDHKTPAAETVLLEETDPRNAKLGRKLQRTESIFYEMLYTPESNGMNSEGVMDKERHEGQAREDVPCSPQEEAGMTNHRAEDHPEEVESHHEEEETLASLEPPPEIPRENQTTVKNLSPSPESSTSPDPPSPPKLTEGSHFMCV
uniref:pleckstrin homology domain-containing family A member 5 isoform X13 n=1 Tax=Myodes glareolus TaxID=447135 RepID=UPI0020216062|nr:pleckstrin homology domain-containing family A member 5 isoform X13 [Myodes glareolus]